MRYLATFIITALFCSTAATAPEPVTCDSPCDCHNAHGEGRWSVKTDASPLPTDASAIQAVTPSDVFSWPGPDAPLTMQSERTGIENKWYALKGRVVELKVEADGDLHIAVRDASGDKPGIVVVEVPAKPQWCETRQTVFSWTRTRFPLHIHSTRTLNLGGDGPVVTVIGNFLSDYRDSSSKNAVRISSAPTMLGSKSVLQTKSRGVRGWLWHLQYSNSRNCHRHCKHELDNSI